MIVAERKPLEEIKGLIADDRKVLILGCGTCVAICFAGGEKQVGLLATELRIARQMERHPIEITEETVERQCEWEFVDPVEEKVRDADVILSMACGIGVQTVAERFPGVRVVPALNTSFLGQPVEQGVWSERCLACGDCVLGLTAGICPIARCAKSLLNGPCGGSQEGKCEVNPDLECAWQLIYDRLKAMGRLDDMIEITPPKDWSAAHDGGPRTIVREDLKI